MAPVAELTFKRAMINIADSQRLNEGEDLNDALLDFFMKLGQALIPKGGENVAPTSYLGAIFFKQLRSAFATSGEEGWKNVQNWAKRKAGGLFKPSYAAFAVPINEDLKDDKGQDAGNHWWLALVLNPHGGANKKEATSVMCLDSMQRRDKALDPPLEVSMNATPSGSYTVKVTKMEQAGYLVILNFHAKGDGSRGGVQRPEASTLVAGGVECKKPTLGLRINMEGGQGVAGEFMGQLTFSLDGRVRTSCFDFYYGEKGTHPPMRLEFDPFTLTKLQKDVSRYLGGYLAKEWEVNGPDKCRRFQKTSARALVADVYQQENLNDCGVFVLENTLRSLKMKPEFLRQMADATPAVLKSFPWPSQQEITVRKQKLKAIVARLFSAGADKGCGDVEKLIKDDDELKAAVLAAITEESEGDDLEDWSEKLTKELAARQVAKDNQEAEIKRKEEEVQARREEERERKAEEARKAEEIRLQGKRPPGSKRSPSRSRSKKKSKDKDKKKKKKKESSEDSRDRSEDQSSEESRRAKKKKKPPPSKKNSGKSKKRRAASDDSRDASRSRSRSASEDESRSPSRKKRRR
eukprot:TRINITY_DN27183_c0_g1_i1.p1 TRINITY_DN27183_c0_g1~~TRINITY_DN27183_c0_g1_i1.p1  ORF type:complete len:623 (+),score=155.83 TRINITY_DN27183_c0_g1_i1:136-1869(+)